MPRIPVRLDWPRCSGGCGNPAAPIGPPVLDVEYDVETRNEANGRIPWQAKQARKVKAREATIEAISIALASGSTIPESGPWYVIMTRRSPSKLDTDGLSRSLKGIQDTVAAILRVDDGSSRVEWVRRQSRGKTIGVRIQIWG